MGHGEGKGSEGRVRVSENLQNNAKIVNGLTEPIEKHVL